jgi:hypothetical protein
VGPLEATPVREHLQTRPPNREQVEKRT